MVKSIYLLKLSKNTSKKKKMLSMTPKIPSVVMISKILYINPQMKKRKRPNLSTKSRFNQQLIGLISLALICLMPQI
jgi:hypothetical protein